MKMNWGNGIALTFTFFCGLMIFLVVKSFDQDFYLVSEHYYADELKYQERIDELKQAQGESNAFRMEDNKQSLDFFFPNPSGLKGEIHFYKPDNDKWDQRVKISSSETKVSKEILMPGRYIAKVSWEATGKSFYQEKELFIQQ